MGQGSPAMDGRGEGAAIAIVTAWLEGELVDRLGMSVDEDASMNAPSSLHKRHVAAGK